MEAVFSAQDGLETKSAEDKLSRSAKILFKHHSEKDQANTFQTTKTNHGSLQISVEKEAVAEEASYLYVCHPT